MLVVGLAEKMWFLSGWIPGSAGAGTWRGPQGGCWEQLVCVWVRGVGEPGHGGGHEPRPSLCVIK